MKQPNPFKWHHFEAEIILLCVRWYLHYSLSYRDLEEMLRERGLQVDHTTIYRWVQRYAPELEKQGYETTHMIRKGQMHGVEKGDIRSQVTFIAHLFGVAA